MFSHNKSKQLLIIVPAYNEAGAIRRVVCGVHYVVPHADILVIDDCSTDQTLQEAVRAGAFVVRHPYNLCIGGTFQTGLKFAQMQGYEQVVRIDGDGQHDPNDIPYILSALQPEQADVAICSRFLETKSTMHIPWARRIGIFFFSQITSLLTGQKVTDPTSGFMGLNRRAINLLAVFMPQDYPEVENRVILHKAGLKVVEIPTCMHDRTAGVSSINSWRSLYYALKVSIAVLICAIKAIPVVSEDELLQEKTIQYQSLQTIVPEN